MRGALRLTLFLACLVVTLGVTATPSLARSKSDFAREAEARIEQLISKQRAKYARQSGVLMRNDDLDELARERSDDMVHGAPFSHTDSKGGFIAYNMVAKKFHSFRAVGENILQVPGVKRMDPDEFAEEAVDYWMNSKAHRENILSSRFQSSGIGVAIKGDMGYATQIFMGAAPR